MGLKKILIHLRFEIHNREYWICKKIEGIFPKKLRLFRDERIRQKELGNTVKQMALKILINGGYGVFGSRFFKYYDPRVAEIITAYGRYTLTKMQESQKRWVLMLSTEIPIHCS
jgi:DNA polymerase elongation subunit (family B)